MRERDIHTCPAAHVKDCEGGSGWGGSLSNAAGERSQYSRTCPAAYVCGSAAGKGGVGGNLLRTVSSGLWEGDHGGTCYRQHMSRIERPAGPSGPCNVRPSVLKDRSREESACEKSAALIRRPAQDREQPQREASSEPLGGLIFFLSSHTAPRPHSSEDQK